MCDDSADEDELLRQVAAGDMLALEALYRGMRVQVFAVALAVAGDRGVAEDVVQGTFVRVYSAAPGYRPGSRARAWVLTIARHLALDAVRRAGSRHRQRRAAARPRRAANLTGTAGCGQRAAAAWQRHSRQAAGVRGC